MFYWCFYILYVGIYVYFGRKQSKRRQTSTFHYTFSVRRPWIFGRPRSARKGGLIASDIPTIITHFANVSIKIKGGWHGAWDCGGTGGMGWIEEGTHSYIKHSRYGLCCTALKIIYFVGGEWVWADSWQQTRT